MTEECGKPAAYRYTWPGRDESFVCEEHSQKLQSVAEAMFFHLQIIPVEGETCKQQIGSRK